MEVRLRTLTPLWTGGVKGECTKLRETSILGSLRWWFEAIVRGFGGYACDPTSNVKCELDAKKYNEGKDPKELICPSCYVFGTTGWARRFRLKIDDSGFSEIKPTFIIRTREEERHKGWFLGKEDSGGVLGEFTIGIYETYDMCKDLVLLLLHLSSLWGIGAKTQDGFGICEFNGNYNIKNSISQIKYLIDSSQNDQVSKGYNRDILPNLEDFFFAKIIIKENIEDKIKNILEGKLYKKVKDEKSNQFNIVNVDFEEFLNSIPEDNRGRFYPTAPLIRDWLRSLFRDGNDDLRHFLFGFVSIKGTPTPMCKKHLTHTIKEEINRFKCKSCKKIISKNEYFEKMSSKIFVSHIYKINNHWEFKIWGYIPEVLPNNENRDNVLEKLFDEIKTKKNFASILDLDQNSIEVEWYGISTLRSEISSVNDLISNILEVNKDE